MTLRYALISCTKLKSNVPCTAKEMYSKSTLFKKASTYIEQQGYDKWFIISAKYGLVDIAKIIEPYDLTLNNMSVAERRNWAEKVFQQLQIYSKPAEIDFYAGQKYRDYLIPILKKSGISCSVPLKGKGIGEQLQFYKANSKL